MVWYVGYAPFGASPPFFVCIVKTLIIVSDDPDADRIAGMIKRVIAGLDPAISGWVG